MSHYSIPTCANLQHLGVSVQSLSLGDGICSVNIHHKGREFTETQRAANKAIAGLRVSDLIPATRVDHHLPLPDKFRGPFLGWAVTFGIACRGKEFGNRAIRCFGVQ